MKEYFPRLDALRFVAFLVVFFNHIPSFVGYPSGINTPGTPWFVYLQDGDLAVGFFFVLSAFLVTYLFEREREKKGTLSLANFYRRRILRIWPLYFLVIGIIVLVSYLVGLEHFTFVKAGLSFLEVGAATLLLTGLTRPFLHTVNEMLAVLWSISVEEQFYLLWSSVYRFFRRYVGYILLLAVLVSIGFRYVYANAFEFREFYTPTTMVYLCIGAAAGIYGVRFRSWIVLHVRTLSIFSMMGVIALLSVRGFVFPHVYPQWFASIDAPLFGMCFALLILANAFGAVSAVERSKNTFMAFLEYLGSISYGLYVYHLVAFTIVMAVLSSLHLNTPVNGMTFAGIVIITFILTLGMASASYRFFETPFLLLKKKFSSA